MQFTQDSLLPENQEPLIITAAPFGPQSSPSDYPEDIAVCWTRRFKRLWTAITRAPPSYTSTSDPKSGKIPKKLQGIRAAKGFTTTFQFARTLGPKGNTVWMDIR